MFETAIQMSKKALTLWKIMFKKLGFLPFFVRV